MKRQQYVMGNWKMNGSKAMISPLLQAITQEMPQERATQVVVFPPTLYVPMVSLELSGSTIAWGAQNVHDADHGAYTGEVSCPMLREYGCQYVLVGHSERRTLFHEDEKYIAKKFHQVKDHGMIPVLCVGETESERKAGETLSVIRRQLTSVVEAASDNPQHNQRKVFEHCIIAYEPVWAIGTGLSASPNDAQDVHAEIRACIKALSPGCEAGIPILYGGSVNANNALDILAMPDIDGGLVGGASLDATQFLEIMSCTKSY